MSVEKTLLRVEADLAAGDLALARQRLDSLIVTFPTRLEVREQLARVCRLQGDLVQAGRWSYLSDDRDPIEVSAFEKATLNRVERMRALRWPSSPEEAATQTARERLEELLQEARSQIRSRSFSYEDVAARHWTPPGSRRERIGEAVGIAILVLILGLFVIGVIDGIATVASWLR